MNTLAIKDLSIDIAIFTYPKRNISDEFYAHNLKVILELSRYCYNLLKISLRVQRSFIHKLTLVKKRILKIS